MNDLMYKHVLFKDLYPYLRRTDYLGGFTSTEQAYIRKNIGAASLERLEQDINELLNKTHNVSYSDLQELISNGALIPGQVYAINNFRTMYQSTELNEDNKYVTWGNTIHPSTEYTLLALALTPTQLMANVFVLGTESLYWIVQYDPTPETLDDGQTTMGKIVYMQDNNFNSATYDFKNILFEQDGRLWHTFSDSEGNDNSENCFNNNLCSSYDVIIKVPVKNLSAQCTSIHIDSDEIDLNNDTSKQIISLEGKYYIDYLDLETLTHQFYELAGNTRSTG